MDDKILRQNVVDELDYEPSIDSAHIGVTVRNGVVTLTGHVPNYMQKSLAEDAVRRVKGVRGIAEEITVNFGVSSPYSDDDIAKRVLTVLDFNVLVPAGAVQVKVQQGWLTLGGEVEWGFQRTAALQDLSKLRGVSGITNDIVVKPRVSAHDIERRIGDALKRTTEREANAVKVSVCEGAVTLIGHVSTWADRYAVERAAWSAPGVRSIDDQLVVA
jgi:osmotically-inducible protein OsmY